jgi:hypothetical protein
VDQSWSIYDPAANTWTSITPPSLPTPWANIGDAPSVILPDGTYMQADCCGVALQMESAPLAAYFDEASMSWTELNQSTKFDEFDEEGWTLLPNGKVLTVDAYVACPSDQPGCTAAGNSGSNSEFWNPSTQTWSSAGSTIVQLWDSKCGAGGGSYEVGPGVLRPDGTVYYTGSSDCEPGHTAIYNSVTGIWTKGPDFPNNDAANDAPASIETNGKVIVMASPYSGTFSAPSRFYEWNGSALSAFPAPPNAVNDASFVGHLLVFPTGQIMFTDFTTDAEILTTAGSWKSSWRPTMLSFPKSVSPGKANYSISGTQFNGLTQATAYGDDLQNATNYPLVRIVNTSSGHVFYCKTHNHTSMGVATGSALVSTKFDVPADIELDPASCTWWRTAFPRRHKESASSRTHEHGHHQGNLATSSVEQPLRPRIQFYFLHGGLSSVCTYHPRVSVRINNLAAPVSPKHVRDRALARGSEAEGLGDYFVDVFNVDKQTRR